MHVLGLPPAFVLSQDQTLKLKAACAAILDVRTSAHHHMTLLTSCGVSLFVVLLVSSETESRQTVKLTLYHRIVYVLPPCGYLRTNPKSVDIQTLIHRTEPNRPHISSDISISNSVETKETRCALTSWRAPPRIPLIFLVASRFRPSAFPLQCGPSGAPLCASAPPVRGVLRLVTETRNPFFQEKCIFCDKPDFSHVLGGLRQFQYADAGSVRNFLRRNRNRIYQIWGYPQSLPQVSPRSGQTHGRILA